MVRPTYQHVIARAKFTLRGAPGTWGIFANIGEGIGKGQINVLTSARRAHDTEQYDKSALVIVLC